MKRMPLFIFSILISACGAVGPSQTTASGGGKKSQDALADTDEDSDTQGKKASKSDKKTPGAINLEELSLAAFEKTVYPILTENCGACHGSVQSPFIGHDNAKTAFHAVIDNNKVNFNDIPGSRLVQRLAKDNHQCWSGDCDDDAAKMQAAIETWKKTVDEAGAKDKGDQANTTAAQPLRAADESEPTGDPGTMIQLAADYSDIVSPMEVRNDGNDGEITSYILTPQGNGGRIQPNQQGGEAYFTFDVTVAGTYAVWGRILAPNGNNNSFHIRMDNGPIESWATDVTGTDWAWNRANQNNGGAELTFDLTPGTHTVMIKQREERTQLNRIALSTQLEDFSEDNAVIVTKALSYDLSALTGKNARLIADVGIWDEASHTYIVQNLRVETDEELYLKDIMPMINDQWNPQNATFRLVDQTISAPGANLSSAALIMIGQDGWDKDELSFAFGEIK